MIIDVLLLIVGLVLILGGANYLTQGSASIARRFGLSDLIVGLTIVALGTSAPELTISEMSAIDGNPGMAIGNVIGSTIFNIFLVLGTSAVIRPLPFGGVSMLDLEVLSGSALMFWIFGWFFRQRTITRAEGGIMAPCYVGYIAYLVIQAI